MQEYKFKFSVVIPVYNAEKYLEETIESVINQDIGFKENIQMILVNDGSLDNSEDICMKYKVKYPDNIIYVKQENSGVSNARNNGMKYIQGKYTNFLDADDKWGNNVFLKVWNFFEENQKKINLVACRMKFFEAREDFHTLDYKFQGDRVIDILEDYNFIQLHITSSFIKSDILYNYKFDTRLKYAEDSKFIAQIIVDKKKYGIVSNAIHFYRKRLDESSAVQNKEKSREWYFDTPQYMYKEIMEKSINIYGYVIPYIQYMVMYDIQFRIKENIPEFLSDNEKEKYFNVIVEILQPIEDYIICEQKKIYSEHKIYALCLKYKRDIRKELVYRKNRLYFNNLQIYNLKNKSLFSIDILNVQKNRMIIEGQINCILPEEDFEIYIQLDNGKKYKLKFKDIETNNRYCLNGILLKNKKYLVKIPLNEVNSFKFMMKYKKTYNRRLSINFKRYSKLNQRLEKTYFNKGKYIISTKNNTITVKKKTKTMSMKNELDYLKELAYSKKYNMIFYRFLYKINKRINKKDIWLLCDKLPNRSDDNAKFLFKYIADQKNKTIKLFYILSKKNKEYKELRRKGKIIKPYSFKHKLYFLLCKNYISSHAIEDNINPFREDIMYVRDLYNSNFVFLQHGITKDDFSKGMNKFTKNIALFITSGKPEYESIINGNYNYTDKEVKLTGFPRFDELYNRSRYNKKERTILILPTWRKNIKDSYDMKTYESVYSNTFKSSEFYKFYNTLINDRRIIEKLRKYGFKIKLCLHPIMKEQWRDFKGNEFSEINSLPINYTEEFTKNAMLITDFSSVFFDFAYLKKPIIYTQFDVDTFFGGGHTYDKGYFEYERDGFGPVCYDYESTVKTIIEYIEKDCVIEDKYLERINNFYAYNDQNNCKRVYEEILKLK